MSSPTELLREIATTLRHWATESRSGGWSTHQVDPQRALANRIDEALARPTVGGEPLDPEPPAREQLRTTLQRSAARDAVRKAIDDYGDAVRDAVLVSAPGPYRVWAAYLLNLTRPELEAKTDAELMSAVADLVPTAASAPKLERIEPPYTPVGLMGRLHGKALVDVVVNGGALWRLLASAAELVASVREPQDETRAFAVDPAGQVERLTDYLNNIDGADPSEPAVDQAIALLDDLRKLSLAWSRKAEPTPLPEGGRLDGDVVVMVRPAVLPDGSRWSETDANALLWTNEHGDECRTEILDDTVCSGVARGRLWRNVGTPTWACVAVLTRAAGAR